MYTILVNDDNSLQTTVRERIMQRSKLVDTLHFLVEPTYKEQDMSDFTVTMEYLLPVSREYRTENLVKSDALYKDMLEAYNVRTGQKLHHLEAVFQRFRSSGMDIHEELEDQKTFLES